MYRGSTLIMNVCITGTHVILLYKESNRQRYRVRQGEISKGERAREREGERQRDRKIEESKRGRETERGKYKVANNVRYGL